MGVEDFSKKVDDGKTKIKDLDGKLAAEEKVVTDVTKRKEFYKGKVAGVTGENTELKGQVQKLIDQLNASKGLKISGKDAGAMKAAVKAKGAAKKEAAKLKGEKEKA